MGGQKIMALTSNHPEPATNTPEKVRCDQCSFYNMIDSGYGYCNRFPPTKEPIKIKPNWCESLGKKKLEFDEPIESSYYPVIPWDLEACGELKVKC